MTLTFEIADDLKARVDAIAARSSLTASEVIVDALQNGHSLEWQEQFLDKVAKGIAAADREDFATADEVKRVVGKYRGA